jgi:type I restriction enzyme M protein
MLRNMELLASVDLPGEAFLPQVSVQASCVFLRRRDPSELTMAGTRGPKQQAVFMAIAENCGHGRRGETRYLRRPDGTEDSIEETVTTRWERGKTVEIRERTRKARILADDMPWIAEQYRRYVTGQKFDRS